MKEFKYLIAGIVVGLILLVGYRMGQNSVNLHEGPRFIISETTDPEYEVYEWDGYIYFRDSINGLKIFRFRTPGNIDWKEMGWENLMAAED